MSEAFDAFVLSLGQEAPSPTATPLVQAVWLGLRGQWQAAHEIAQAREDTDSAWVHAWLHRIEGDLGNAQYWYRSARRETGTGDTRSEGLAIARALIQGDPA